MEEKLHLNCKGMRCPMPTIEITKMFKKMAIGQVLEVVADNDPAFFADVEVWAKKMNYEILEKSVEGDVARVVIKKKEK